MNVSQSVYTQAMLSSHKPGRKKQKQKLFKYTQWTHAQTHTNTEWEVPWHAPVSHAHYHAHTTPHPGFSARMKNGLHERLRESQRGSKTSICRPPTPNISVYGYKINRRKNGDGGKGQDSSLEMTVLWFVSLLREKNNESSRLKIHLR